MYMYVYLTNTVHVCVCFCTYVHVCVCVCVTEHSLPQEQLSTAGGDSTHLLSEMSSHLRHLLKQWFSTGLMDIQQLTWESPCDIMEKVGGV